MEYHSDDTHRYTSKSKNLTVLLGNWTELQIGVAFSRSPLSIAGVRISPVWPRKALHRTSKASHTEHTRQHEDDSRMMHECPYMNTYTGMTNQWQIANSAGVLLPERTKKPLHVTWIFGYRKPRSQVRKKYRNSRNAWCFKVLSELIKWFLQNGQNGKVTGEAWRLSFEITTHQMTYEIFAQSHRELNILENLRKWKQSMIWVLIKIKWATSRLLCWDT
jgi:hypothetical protein